ncbi:shufflon system plasmid conjugative transfer pilus tip adhesin PilV [Shigella flexneri]
MKIKNKNYVNGFTLIELILALGVGVMVSFIKFQDMKNEQDLMKASAAGEQIQRIGYAVNNYISLRYDKLSTLTSSSSQSNDPGPRTCSGNTCTITVQTLKNEGILPNSYVDSNAFRSPYSIIIKRSGSSPNYTLDALITTSAAWIESGNNPRYDLLGFAMQKAGIDSGMTKSNTKADGYNGSWSEQSTSFNNITKAGQLAFRAGYNASLYSAYLRRDGTLPMTGNLNMGNNDINNAKNITASGTGNFGSNVNSGGNVTAAAQVIAHNGYGDTITLGGDAAGNDYEIRLGTAKQLTLYSPSAGNYTTVLQVNRNAKIDQRLGLMGYDPNELPSGWGGGLRTLDVYAAGTVGTGSGGTVNAYMNSSGNIYASNDINAGHQVNAQYVWASGNLNSNYIHSNGNIDADRRINAGEFVYINGQATIGAGCSPNGLIGRTSEGRAVSCVNGAWQAVGSFTRTGCYNVGNHDGRNFNPEYCNVGDYVAGLQFTGHRRSESTYEVICCKP